MRLPLIYWRLGLEPLLRRLHFLVLTTRGRRSGLPRHTMLEHSLLEGKVYVAPGWGQRTQWYLNVLSDPRVTVQRNGETWGAVARIVTAETELSAIYSQARQISPVWKQYLASWGIEDTLEDFLAKRDRVPALRLDRIEGQPPLPPLACDLRWVWLVVAAFAGGIIYFYR